MSTRIEKIKGEIEELKSSVASKKIEIVLTPEKAEAAGVEAEVVHPGAFREVIQAGGQCSSIPRDLPRKDFHQDAPDRKFQFVLSGG